MRMTIAVLVAAFALFAMPAVSNAGSVNGTWQSESGKTRVKMSKCGGSVCGTIVWVKNPGKDVKNQDASKRGRNLVGIRMVKFSETGANEYEGTLYNDENGKTYSGKMSLSSANKMKMSGCIAGGLICHSTSWTRVGN